ncbi:MAG: hypothetical protein AAF802_10750 [Planctomycetota bacterium]
MTGRSKGAWGVCEYRAGAIETLLSLDLTGDRSGSPFGDSGNARSDGFVPILDDDLSGSLQSYSEATEFIDASTRTIFVGNNEFDPRDAAVKARQCKTNSTLGELLQGLI